MSEEPEEVADDEQRSKRRGGWFRIALLAVLVLIAVLLAVNLIGQERGGTNTAPGTEHTESPAPTEAAPEESRGGNGTIAVAAGEGGSAVATADGHTPVGYELTCTGAVQAATNYLIALQEYDSENLLSVNQYVALVDELSHGITATKSGSPSDIKVSYVTRMNRIDSFEGYFNHVNLAAGLFRVTECDEDSAVIDIAYPGTRRFPTMIDGQPAKYDNGKQVWEEITYLTSDRVYLEVADQDWALARLVTSAEMEDDPAFAIEREIDEEFTPEDRAAVLEVVEKGWREYTNAPD